MGTGMVGKGTGLPPSSTVQETVGAFSPSEGLDARLAARHTIVEEAIKLVRVLEAVEPLQGHPRDAVDGSAADVVGRRDRDRRARVAPAVVLLRLQVDDSRRGRDA